MKVKNHTKVTSSFQPLTLTITIETEKEAKALRILWGAMSEPTAQRLLDGTTFFKKNITKNDICHILDSIAPEIEKQSIYQLKSYWI